MNTPIVRDWRAAAAVGTGARHLARGAPCQDAAAAKITPRPFVIVCDGKGSSDISQEGSVVAVARFSTLLRSLEPLVRDALDAESMDLDESSRQWRRCAEVACRLLAEDQERLADASGRPVSDFVYTIAVAVIGMRRCGWFQIGDSILVAQVAGRLALVREPYTGEFANHTVFVRPDLNAEAFLYSGLLPASGLEAVAACSDGMAFHLVELQGLTPAEGCRQIFASIAIGECSAMHLEAVLAAERWSRVNGDDRGLAVLAASQGCESPRTAEVDAAMSA
ncbi:MAG: protein phosphatase 2C domain-containing protein [Opitutaceae bacterium]|nr:protein phosphatase 2C domain-containing protein [Opitutaceae bacterium]